MTNVWTNQRLSWAAGCSFRESTINSNKMFIATFPSDVWKLTARETETSPHTLTWFADEQGTDESGVHIPHCVHLGGVGVGEALGVTAGGAIFMVDVPHILVVTSWKDSVILLLLAHCGIIVPNACKENSLLRIPRHDFRSRSESKQEKKNPKTQNVATGMHLRWKPCVAQPKIQFNKRKLVCFGNFL